MSGATFLERVVAFPPMLAGNEREALLAVADQLSIELGYPEGAEPPGARSPLTGDDGPMAGILNSEDELLVAKVRGGLAKVAAALADESLDSVSRNAVG